MPLIDMSEIFQMTNVGDHIDGTDVYQSNPNLLDNAYFVGGGSQLGDGIFPINQRGQTSYSAYVNSIDRWYAAAAMTIAADGLSCGAMVQKLPQVANLNGKTLTFSALMADSTMLSGSAVFNSASDTYFYSDAGANEYLLYSTYFGGFEVVTAKKIAAVKLELGTVSTLANDVPPDFGAELAKCQRRLFRVSPMGTSSRGYAGFGSANSSKNILVFVPTPVTLAEQPTVSFSNCNAYNYVAGGSIAISSISIDSWTQNGVFLSCTPSDASQVVQYQPYVLRVAQGGYLQFYAEPQ